MKQLWNLFFTFFKIGLFTFGGGYAMIAQVEKICVEQKGWLTHEDMMNMVVVAEATPGPVAINSATFVGYRQRGMAGAVVATLGTVLPSFIIIYVISLFLDKFLAITWIANAFRGINVAVGVLIADVGIKMFLKMKKSLLPVILSAASFAILIAANLLGKHISTIVLMLFAAAISLILCFAEKRKEAGK